MQLRDFEVLQKTTTLNESIYYALKKSDDFRFTDKIVRSGISLSSNIIESIDNDTKSNNKVLLSHAKGSCNELKNYIKFGTSKGIIDKKIGKQWLTETDQIVSMLNTLIKSQYNGPDHILSTIK
ncbi:MAG: four helix bundle protein [Deltaproteobacteria bacterium]|nr:four helix bundle protein [Deltaproteobacteria bacterium]MBN2687316.1 four helix bundle protein [Deltaproteobacteria bacterium]